MGQWVGGCWPLGSLPGFAVQLGQVGTMITASKPLSRDGHRLPYGVSCGHVASGAAAYFRRGDHC